jgi:tape measure domain-containing protein
MTTDMQRLIVSLEARTKSFENALNRANNVANQRAKAIDKRFKDLNKSVTASFANMLKGGVAIGGAGLGTREITQYADAWTEAGNKVRAAAQSAGVEARSLDALKDGANEARVALEDYVDLYARLIRSASGVAKSEEEIARATTIVSKAFKAGGASAAEQASGILQLGQALGSGVLQGDELKSLRENAPVLAQAIADEFKTTIAGLKDLGSEGKLTSDRVFQAILNAQKPIEAQFAATNATIGDSFMQLRNNLTQYIGTQAEAYGVTQTVANILGALSSNIDSVTNAAAAAGLVLAATFGRGAVIAGVAALANPFVAIADAIGAAAFALSAFGDQIQPIQGDLANLQDYAVVIWDNVKNGAVEASAVVSDTFLAIANIISDALGGAEVSWSDLADFAVTAADQIINSFVLVYDTLVATFTKLPGAIAEAVVSAMNSMIGVVEAAINKVVSGVNSAIAAINGAASAAATLAGTGGAVGSGMDPNTRPANVKLIAEVGRVELGRVENSYAGAGKAAGAAYADAMANTAKTRVRDALGSIRDQANARAAERTINQLPFNPLPPIGGENKNTAGFGAGIAGGAPGGSGGGGKGKKGGGRSKGDSFEREIEQIKERTAALQAETLAQAGVNPLIDDYGFAVEKAAAQQDLLNAAKDAGLIKTAEMSAATPELAEKIDQLSTAYANASVAAEQLEDRQDQVKKAADDFRDSAKDITGGFISDLRNGKSAAEALAGALDKVVDKLIDVALNSVFDGAGGGGGGFLGGLFSIFGFAKGGIAAHGKPLKTFARGGVSRTAAIFGEAGPEAAVPLPDGRNIPVKLMEPRIPQASPKSNDTVTIVLQDDSGRMAEIADRRIETASGTIVKVAVTESTRRIVPTMAQHQRDKAGGEWR